MFEYFPNNYPWSLAVMGALSRGGQVSEIDDACRPLREIAAKKNDPAAQAAWFESWMKLAERVERLADSDAQKNHPLSAGRKYMRAGLYYLMAERMPSHKDPRRLIAYRRGIELYGRGLTLRREPVERVEVPYGEHSLPAFFVKAPVAGRAPCMVHFDGFDATKETIYGSVGEEYRRRGISLLIVDHPGVGEALRLRQLHSGPDTEKPAAAAVDYLETRADVDRDRIGIVALSLGGYYAPRAAAFEKRFKACVALSGPFQRSADFTGRPQMNVEAFRVRSKSADLEEAGKVALRFTLAECAKNITCPIYIVAGTQDRLTPHTQAERLAAAVSGPCVLSVIEGGNHVVNNLWYRYRDQTADWMASQLGVAKR